MDRCRMTGWSRVCRKGVGRCKREIGVVVSGVEDSTVSCLAVESISFTRAPKWGTWVFGRLRSMAKPGECRVDGEWRGASR